MNKDALYPDRSSADAKRLYQADRRGWGWWRNNTYLASSIFCLEFSAIFGSRRADVCLSPFYIGFGARKDGDHQTLYLPFCIAQWRPNAMGVLRNWTVMEVLLNGKTMR